MSYALEILRVAQKQLAQIATPQRQRIVDAIRNLTENPHPSGSKKLSGRPAWRVRVGDYRIIYEIYDGRLLILVVAVGHRKDVYK